MADDSSLPLPFPPAAPARAEDRERLLAWLVFGMALITADGFALVLARICATLGRIFKELPEVPLPILLDWPLKSLAALQGIGLLSMAAHAVLVLVGMVVFGMLPSKKTRLMCLMSILTFYAVLIIFLLVLVWFGIHSVPDSI